MNTTPLVMCTLGPEALAARRENLLAKVAALATVSAPLDDGRRFEFEGSDETLATIASMIQAERKCCRFLQFHMTVAPSGGPISLELTGPPGTRDFLDAIFK